jgi:hypothetical protein
MVITFLFLRSDQRGKDDEDSCGLPIDYDLWPKIGEKIYCKVLWHRDLEKEVSLAIVNPKA